MSGPREAPGGRSDAGAEKRPFVHRVTVRFGDVDHARIVYYPVFGHWFHVAFEEVFPDRMGLPYRDVIDERGLGFPTVREEVDFRAPVRYGDALRIEVTTKAVGTSSLTLGFRVVREGDGAVCAEATYVKACVRMDWFTSTPIPDWVRDGFDSLGGLPL